MPEFASLPPADRFALIIEGLRHAVARRGGQRSGLGGLAGPFLVLIWARLRRYAARFTRHATLPPLSRTKIRRPEARPTEAKRPARPRPPPPLPCRDAWLIRLIPETAAGASQLRHFLGEPDVVALLAKAPQLGRILRPLCRALGIRPAQIPTPPVPPPDAAPTARPIPSCAPAHTMPAAIPSLGVAPQATPPPQPSCAAPLAGA